MCDKRTPCRTKREHGRHLVTAQAGTSGEISGSGGGEQVYGLPSGLFRHLFQQGIESSGGSIYVGAAQACHSGALAKADVLPPRFVEARPIVAVHRQDVDELIRGVK